MRVEEGLEKRISTDKLLDYIEWCEEKGLDANISNLTGFLKHLLSQDGVDTYGGIIK